jgi:hypothetical protein
MADRGGIEVTAIIKTGERKLMLFSGRAYPALAREVA